MRSSLKVFSYLIKGVVQYTFHRGTWEDIMQDMENSHKKNFPDAPFYIPHYLGSKVIMAVEYTEEDITKSINNFKTL